MDTRTMKLIVGAAFVVGCAGRQPTPHLTEAREAYHDARTGIANQYAPDEVYEAKMALDAAEDAHDRKPGSEIEKHKAYVAHRKARIAMSSANAKKAVMDGEKAEEAQKRIAMSQSERLEQTNDRLEQTKEALDREKQRRTAAERTASEAMKSLNQIASIKAEEERVVITLSGEVLFKFNEATLLPIAQSRLDKVAEVLKDAGDGKPIVIEGHTDSRGTSAYNDELSRKRAEAVRSYLVGKGVPESMIEAVGRGEQEPIADNRSAEGRANNRRVEIIIDESATRTSRR